MTKGIVLNINNVIYDYLLSFIINPQSFQFNPLPPLKLLAMQLESSNALYLSHSSMSFI